MKYCFLRDVTLFPAKARRRRKEFDDDFMDIALYFPDNMPESFQVYANNVAHELANLDCQVNRFRAVNQLPEKTQVIWDPRAGGGHPPILELCGRPQPLVVTLHGVAPMAISVIDYFTTWKSRVRGLLSNYRKRAAWRSLKNRYAAIITVSHYSKNTIIQQLPVDAEQVFPCYNAVDHRIFYPDNNKNFGDYFLHISNDEPRKNIDRICAAYLQLPMQGRPPLRLKLPLSSQRASHDGIQVIRERLSDIELVKLYRGAIGFLFPSLFEGFGLPILEAMACGCPVVTADDNACAEVAGRAALTVNSRSVTEIRDSMRRLIHDRSLRKYLVEEGQKRASIFSWEKAAHCHLAVFREALINWRANGTQSIYSL